MRGRTDYLLDVAVIGFPHTSNLDDFDPIKRQQSVRVRYVEANDELGLPDVGVMSGTKTTVRDLEWMWERGCTHRVRLLAGDGVAVVDVCGGYQMLGDCILDLEVVESVEPEILPVTAVFEGTKETRRMMGEARSSSGILQAAARTAFEGYEIHMGRTSPSAGGGWDGDGPFLLKEWPGSSFQHVDWAVDSRGMVLGIYIHWLFYNQPILASVLAGAGGEEGCFPARAGGGRAQFHRCGVR